MTKKIIIFYSFVFFSNLFGFESGTKSSSSILKFCTVIHLIFFSSFHIYIYIYIYIKRNIQTIR